MHIQFAPWQNPYSVNSHYGRVSLRVRRQPNSRNGESEALLSSDSFASATDAEITVHPLWTRFVTVCLV
jgi:hypothetical protein